MHSLSDYEPYSDDYHVLNTSGSPTFVGTAKIYLTPTKMVVPSRSRSPVHDLLPTKVNMNKTSGG